MAGDTAHRVVGLVNGRRDELLRNGLETLSYTMARIGVAWVGRETVKLSTVVAKKPPETVACIEWPHLP